MFWKAGVIAIVLAALAIAGGCKITVDVEMPVILPVISTMDVATGGSPTMYLVGADYEFSAASSRASHPITKYGWQLIKNGVVFYQTPQGAVAFRYAFQEEGDYVLRLDVFVGPFSNFIEAPLAVYRARLGLTVSPSVTYASCRVWFSASIAYTKLEVQPAAGQLVFAWDFGDGASNTTSAPAVDHVYSSAGRYGVAVTALRTRLDGTASAIGRQQGEVVIYPWPIVSALGSEPKGVVPVPIPPPC